MVADPPAPPATLSEILTHVARRAKDGQLATMAVTGLAGAAIIALVLGRSGWLAAAAALAVGAYGTWGIADRELNKLYAAPGSPGGRVLAWRLARGVSAVTATLAAVSTLGTMFFPLLGLWRS